MTKHASRGWTLAIVSVGLFMVVLDNLVVSVALPSIRRDLGASIQTLEWTVNAYALAYAGLLLTGAALGERDRPRLGKPLGDDDRKGRQIDHAEALEGLTG